MSRAVELIATPSAGRVRVAAGILIREGKVLLSERVGDSPFAGLWEFPGGKLDGEETPLQALERELAEELDIELVSAAHLTQVQHGYPDREVAIDFFVVDDWRGEPRGCDGQALRWERVTTLDPAILLPADLPVVEALSNYLRPSA